ncbi:MAG: hypothetical protein L3J39_11780 [Verrucomicrobiales bacterium]|nr:hypothetical protein [Verrucomicrobiales bacterium]
MKSMRRIPKPRVEQIMAAFDELVTAENPAEHRNVKAMKGDWQGMYRIRIGEYRAIFEMNPDPMAKDEDKLLLLSVEAVGIRGGIYG